MNNDEVLQALAHLVGTDYDDAVKDTITSLTGRARVVGPRDFSTREFDPNRIHVTVDGQGRIKGFEFN
ncbi:hypothetical protein F3J44_16230 [Pantoea sp. Tr-811]|uniref:I78 family peptidase inhibitor n=1 Tax=unclassified Pantoea TaxID=2630326 RepID=UPI0014236FC7|nr:MULTISPECIES: I78 family peptidase inhibitor [unclassified Pantoea]NIE76565.1 hypothetical protein [Pantoea sp. Ap-967]NIF27915.1 hypothetical protein [Pantoea sp. Tr-811]